MGDLEHMLMAAIVLLDQCVKLMEEEPEHYDAADLKDALGTIEAITDNLSGWRGKKGTKK